MKNKTTSLVLAILWTVVLITDIVSAVHGDLPNWTLVFCPLAILVLNRWTDYIVLEWEDQFNGD